MHLKTLNGAEGCERGFWGHWGPVLGSGTSSPSKPPADLHVGKSLFLRGCHTHDSGVDRSRGLGSSEKGSLGLTGSSGPDPDRSEHWQQVWKPGQQTGSEDGMRLSSRTWPAEVSIAQQSGLKLPPGSAGCSSSIHSHLTSHSS